MLDTARGRLVVAVSLSLATVAALLLVLPSESARRSRDRRDL